MATPLAGSRSIPPTGLIGRCASKWGERLIRSWNDRWWGLAADVAARLAPLVGAEADEVLIADSTSVNLHKLASAAMVARPGRDRIITDDLNFSSDVHILDGVADAHDGTLEIITSDGTHGPVDAIGEALDEHTALLSLSLTAYKSGYTYELERLTRMDHEVGALVCGVSATRAAWSRST